MREKLRIDQGWKFFIGDPKVQKPFGHQDVYMASKTERGRGLAARDFYDGDWEDVTLPHDYVIAGDYDESEHGCHGYLKRENAWYRRTFNTLEEDKNKRITLVFDGIVTHSNVWVNGHLMERNFCGYTSFVMDVTDVLKPVGESNVIAVKVDLSEFEGCVIEVGNSDAWDSFCTSNPTFTKTPEGKYRIYYKAWSNETAKKYNGNRQYGYAESDSITGPYVKYENNPVIDYSYIEERIQAEDGYIWHQNDEYHMIMRDMGVFNHEYGLYIHSKDGVKWSEPTISYLDAPSYFDEQMPGLTREGRFERPQVLLKDGVPTHVFVAYRGGKYKTSSGAVLKIQD